MATVVALVGLRWGDLPTWIASVGTVGALGAALFQINTERQRRHAAEAARKADEHQAQARLMSAVMGPQVEDPVNPDHPEYSGRTGIDIINASSEPVYNVVVGVTFVQGAAPHDLEGIIKSHLGGETKFWPVPATTVAVIPPGRFRVWIPGRHWSGILSGRNGAEVAFTDRAGSHWIRRAMGKLEELPSDPLEYFKQFEFYPPYDFQRPEPLD